MEERVSKEAKLSAVKEIVASYVRGAGAEGKSSVTPQQICELFSELYKTIEEAIPEGEKRRVGLGA